MLDCPTGAFRIAGDCLSVTPYGSGHINDTFVAIYDQDGRRRRYVLQKLNASVFPDPVAVMENVARICAHLAGSDVSADAPAERWSPLELIAARDGRPYFVDDGGGYWRSFAFVEGTKSVDVAESPQQVRNAAAAFGRFQCLLADLPDPPLKVTIAGFHDTAKRYEQFRHAVDADAQGRGARAAREIDFALARADLAPALMQPIAAGTLPQRVTHNDTKLNNVLLDAETNAAICVIDLDTVMPGSVLFDFGDLVRSAAITGREDEADASRIGLDLERFAAILDGYLASTAGWLDDAETEALALSCRVMTFECGLRFLTDFLAGDRYFKTAYPDHNLIRCRTQFALLEHMEAEADNMQTMAHRALARSRPTRR